MVWRRSWSPNGRTRSTWRGCNVTSPTPAMLKPTRRKRPWPDLLPENWRHRLRSRKILAVHRSRRPMSCSRLGCRHHAGGAAVIEVAAGPVFAQDHGDIETFRRVTAVVMELHPPLRGEDREIVEKCGLLGRAGAVMQPEIGAAAAQFGDHRHDRGDADAARDQQMMLRCGSQRKVIARRRSLDDVADADPLMPAAGPLSFRFAQHGDAIPRPLGRIVPQREVAHRPIADPYRYMRSGREGVQIMLVRVDQLIAVDPLGEIGNRPNAEQHAPTTQRATSPQAT